MYDGGNALWIHQPFEDVVSMLSLFFINEKIFVHYFVVAN